jgi:tripartite-type tricarboxylate transporter receptor subunit TctC
MIGAQLTERLGKQVIVDNRAGAGGVLGTEIAAQSPPDGHTLLLISTAYAISTSLYKVPYDPVKSFVPVALLASGPSALAVFPGLPVGSVTELVALARAKPGQLNCAAAGVGSFQHLGSELFRLQREQQRDPSVFVRRPTSLGFVAATVLILLLAAAPAVRRRRRAVG